MVVCERRHRVAGNCRADDRDRRPAGERCERGAQFADPRMRRRQDGEADRGGDCHEHRERGEPVAAHADRREQGVLERPVAELVHPGPGPVFAEQREGHRAGEHQHRRGHGEGDRQRRLAPVGGGEAEGDERKRRDQETRAG